jgi:hypothetical protein
MMMDRSRSKRLYLRGPSVASAREVRIPTSWAGAHVRSRGERFPQTDVQVVNGTACRPAPTESLGSEGDRGPP